MKTCLVLEGGAMRGMYTAGALDVFYNAGIQFDGIIGVSAGAAFGVNYLSRQPGRVIRYNKRFNADHHYMGLIPLLKTGNIVDTEYAYEKVPRELDPFDGDTFDASGDRSFSFARKPGADTQLRWDEVNLHLIDEARVFHFGTLSLTDEPARSTTQQAVAYAKAKGKLITCDPNLREPLWKTPAAAKEQMLWSLTQSDVVKISDNEVAFLWGCSPEEGAQRLLEEFDVKLAMVTLGPDGCLLKTKQALFRAPAPAVHPVDTTGAGDIFGGSAVARLLELGKAPEQLTQDDLSYIGSYALTAASLSTEHSGGIPSIPSKEAVLAAMQTGART